jgi:hypothetical protein
MTPNEIALLIGLSLFGATIGIVSGWIAARRSKGMGTALIRALLAAVAIPIIFYFLSGVFYSHDPKGFSIINAILSGFGMMLFIGIPVVAYTVPASVVSAIASHAVFSRCCRTIKESQQANP